MPNSEAIVSEVAPVEMSKLQLARIELNTKKFVDRAKKIHGDKYDYSKSVFAAHHSKLIIMCREHGEFLQTAPAHYSGRGCPKCGHARAIEKKSGSKLERRLKAVRIDGKRVRNTVEQFIESAKLVHGDKYDYSKTVYVVSKSKVCIICKEHGEFMQTPNGHLKGKGCRSCGINTALSAVRPYVRGRNPGPNYIEDFLVRAKAVHGDKYDYSETKYVPYPNKIKIICRVHGAFEQTAHNHLQGSGCRKCGNIMIGEAIRAIRAAKSC